MKKFLFIILFIIFLVAAAIATSQYWFNVNNYKGQIVGIFNSNTNHHLEINGEIKASILPNISIILNDVSIKENKHDKISIFDAKKLVLDVKTLPLFEKKIEVKNMHLIEADFVLFLDNNDSTVDKKHTQSIGNSKLKVGDLSKINENFRLNSLIFKDCSVRIVDNYKNTNIEINPINLQTSFKPGANKISVSAILDNITEDKISLNGEYIIAPNTFELNNFVINYNELYAKGEMFTDLSLSKPSISLKLNSSKINFDKILRLSESEVKKDNKSGESNSKADDEINLDILNDFDARFKVEIDGIKYGKFDIKDEVVIDGKVNGGILESSFNIKKLYNGSFQSSLIANSKNKSNYQLNAKVKNVDLSKLPQFSDNLDIQKGVFNSNINLKSFGETHHKINRNLYGSADFDIDNSEFKGLGLLSQITRFAKMGAKSKGSDEIIFDKIFSSFNIKNAIATSNDFKIISDVINSKGSGVVDLYNKSLEFKLTPKYSNNLDKDTNRLEVPIIIYGSLSSPRVKLDTRSTLLNVIENPAETGVIIDQLKKDFKNGNSIDDLKNLLGK